MRSLIAALLLSTTQSFSPTIIGPPQSSLFSTIEPSTPPPPPPAPEQAATVTTTLPPPLETTAAAPVTNEPATTTTATETATAVSEPPATGAAVPTATSTGEPEKKVTTSNQANYGISLALPDTYVRCGRCATTFALMPDDLGARGRRVACALCTHSWYQTPERLFTLNDGNQLIPLPAFDVTRITSNLEAGRDPDFMGEIKFYVGNLDFGVTEDDLRELFTTVGPVGGVSMAIGPDGRRRGFAFVTMMSKDSLEGCMGLDGKDVKGREIRVNAPNN